MHAFFRLPEMRAKRPRASPRGGESQPSWPNNTQKEDCIAIDTKEAVLGR